MNIAQVRITGYSACSPHSNTSSFEYSDAVNPHRIKNFLFSITDTILQSYSFPYDFIGWCFVYTACNITACKYTDNVTTGRNDCIAIGYWIADFYPLTFW